MDHIPRLLEEAARNVRVKHFPRGQILLHQGDIPRDALILTRGVIKIYDIDDQGNEKILHLVKPYAILPLAFFSGDERDIQWFYTALTDCDVYILAAEQLREYLQSDNQRAAYMMNWFSREVHELLVRLSSLGKSNARGKIIAALKFLAVHHATARRSGWWRVTFAVNHQLLADLTGVTRESAATTMKELQDTGIIRNPRQTILEINFEKLCDQPDK